MLGLESGEGMELEMEPIFKCGRKDEKIEGMPQSFFPLNSYGTSV